MEGGVHSISFVYLVKLNSYAIKLDSQSFAWGWFKEIPARIRKLETIRWPAAAVSNS